MKSTTYAALVLILFFRNIGKGEVNSIKTVIKLADRTAVRITGKDPNISKETKYRVIKDMIKEGVLTSNRKYGNYHIKLTDNVEEYVTELFTIMLDD